MIYLQNDVCPEPSTGRGGMAPPIFLKLYFATEGFKEIWLCVIVKNIQILLVSPLP